MIKTGINSDVCNRVGRFVICVPLILGLQALGSFARKGGRLHGFCKHGLDKIEDFIVGDIDG